MGKFPSLDYYGGGWSISQWFKAITMLCERQESGKGVFTKNGNYLSLIFASGLPISDYC